MGISNFLGLFALLSLPVIVILYMFRPRHKLLDVPSIFLWEELMEDLSKAKKLEKLKKTILLLLDLLIALLITLLLLGIFFQSTKAQSHHILMINGSFSMNAQDLKPSRFEAAKKMAEEYVEKLEGKEELSIILVHSDPELIASRETDHKQAINAIRSLKPGYGNPKLSKIQDLIAELQSDEGASVVYFTDEPYKYAENILVKESEENLALRNISSSLNEGKRSVAITVENADNQAKKAQISLYDGDLYLTTKAVEIGAKSSEIVFFENLNQNISVIHAKLDGEDINPLDNSLYEIGKSAAPKKIALISNGHFFLESFLSLNPSYEVFLSKPEEYKNLSGFDVYIFDKLTPEVLPKDGNILVLDPEEGGKNPLFSANGYINNPSFALEKHPVNRFLEKANFAIGISQTYEKRPDREPIYSAGEKVLAYSTRKGLQKIVVFGFDFRYTDLPLKVDFPILMNNLSEYLLDQMMTDKSKYSAGEGVLVYIKPSSSSANILSPSGKKLPLSLESATHTFRGGAKELGLYSVEQESEAGGEKLLSKSYFAINPPDFASEEELEFTSGNAGIKTFTSRSDIDRILIALLLLALLIELFLRIRKSPLSKKGTLALRASVVLLVILSMLNLKWSLESKYSDTVFVADFSESMHGKDGEVNKFIEDSLEQLSNEDLYGIVSFAERANVEKPLSEARGFQPISTEIEKGSTNMEKGIEKAEFLFNKDHKKRIVLLSDGRENAGDVLKKLSDLKDKKITVDYYPLGSDRFEEVEIDELSVPQHAKLGQDIPIEVKIGSNVQGKAKLYLYGRDKLIEKKDVEIKAGTNNFIFSSNLQETGIVEYRAEIVPERDKYAENNKLSSFVSVEGKLKMLIVQNENFGENYAKLFDNLDVTLIDQSQVPLNIESILYYDAFLLADVSLEKTHQKFIENLAYLVKNQGKSLIVSGGENSYAMGGYYKSKLEEMLPVEMKVKDKEKQENIAMLLVIDKSGSMESGEYGLSKIQLAKEAAVRAAEVLEEKDYLGVIAFDGEPHKVVELQKVSDKEAIKNKILSIKADGGTSIQPALAAAVDALEQNDAALKHIILLTDGMAETSGYEGYIARMKQKKITLSSVAVGQEADTKLLKYLANTGGGRYYMSNVFTDIPTIFAKETVLAGKKYINNISFYPDLHAGSSMLDGIDALPQLHGYVASTEKPMANVVLSGPDGTPILASYHYGLGKTIAFTSDMHGIWSKDFLAWQNNKVFWHKVLSDILNQSLSKDFELRCEYRDGKAQIRLELSRDSKIKERELKAFVVDSQSEKQELTLKLKEPFVYEASFKPKKDGLYFLLTSLDRDGKTETENSPASFSAAFIVPYSDEFRFFNTKVLRPEELVAASGGRVLVSAKDVFTGELESVQKEYETAKLFLVLALLLFLLELCFHMTNLSARLERIFGALRKKKGRDKTNDKDKWEDPKDGDSDGDKQGREKRRLRRAKAAKEESGSASHIDELLKGI